MIVGIDVGSETHFSRAFDWRNFEYTRKPLEFGNTEAGFQTFKAWMDDIAEKHVKDVVIPGMEPTGHYWLALEFLQDNGMRPVRVNPRHVKKSKELDDNNPNKNDRKDPKTIAALVNHVSYIGTMEQMEAFSASIMGYIPRVILERLKQRIETLQECYGAGRDLEADLGGYVVLFPSMTLEEKTEHRNILEKYHAQDDEYEYQNIISTEDGQEWVEELYILSADYGIVMFYPITAEIGGMYSD